MDNAKITYHDVRCPCCNSLCVKESMVSFDPDKPSSAFCDCDCGYVAIKYGVHAFERKPGGNGLRWHTDISTGAKRYGISVVPYKKAQKIIESRVIV